MSRLAAEPCRSTTERNPWFSLLACYHLQDVSSRGAGVADRLRQKDFGIEVTKVIISGQPTALGKHDPSKMTISLPRVRFLDDIDHDKPASKRRNQSRNKGE